MRNFNQKETLNLVLLSVAKEDLPSKVELLFVGSLFIGNVLGVYWAFSGQGIPIIGACNLLALWALSWGLKDMYRKYRLYQQYKQWLDNELEHGWDNAKTQAGSQNLDQDKT